MFALVLVTLAGSVSAFAGISARDAQIAKERMAANCQYNNAVCVGHILIDAMTTNELPQPLPPTGKQTLVLIYANSDKCDGTIGASVVFDENLQKNVQLCNSLPGAAAWSYSLNGRCVNIEDTNTRSACLQAINAVNNNH